jgi:hypothetical protein
MEKYVNYTASSKSAHKHNDISGQARTQLKTKHTHLPFDANTHFSFCTKAAACLAQKSQNEARGHQPQPKDLQVQVHPAPEVGLAARLHNSAAPKLTPPPHAGLYTYLF